MSKAFNYNDLMNKGYASLEDFYNVLLQFGCNFTKSDAELLYFKYNQTKNRKLDYKEVCEHFSQMSSGNKPNINPVYALYRSPPKEIIENIKAKLKTKGVYSLVFLESLFR